MDFLKRFLNNHTTMLIVLGIFVANVFIRIPNLSFPNYPVFDETYYATYAAAYASHKAHIDIHPPLSGMLYSLPLFFANKSAYDRMEYVNYDFVGQGKMELPKSYGVFPYFSLRFVSVFFGALLAISVFLFTKKLAGHIAPALLASFLLTFENAIILETKLILANGMYLSLGFLGLFFFLKKRGVGAGILTGLAISVKLIAGIFGIMALFLSEKFKKIEMNSFLRYFAVALTTFLVFTVLIEGLWIPLAEKERLFEEKIFSPLRENTGWKTLPRDRFGEKVSSLIPNAATPYVKIIGMQFIFSLGGYTISGGGPSFAPSSWYAWPLSFGAFPYYLEFRDITRPALVLMGNPIVWGLGTGGVLVGIKRFLSHIRKRRKVEGVKEKNAIEFLVFSYLSYLALFLLLVRREAFLYHYFPALIISIVLFSILFYEFVERKTPRARYWWYASLVSFVILGFIAIAPYTYGLL